MYIRPVEIVRLPVVPDGQVLQDDSMIDTFTFGAMALKGPVQRTVPYINIEIARHTDSMWMWSTSVFWKGGYRGYRVGAKWGEFTHNREDAIIAAVREVFERHPDLPPGAVEWLLDLCGGSQKQLELFA